jgi:CDP-diglyceride synthetase
MSRREGAHLISFLSQLAIVLGILALFVPMYWDLGNRVSRLEGAFSEIAKPTITQTVVVTTVTLTTGIASTVTTTETSYFLVFLLAGAAVFVGTAGLFVAYVRRHTEPV